MAWYANPKDECMCCKAPGRHGCHKRNDVVCSNCAEVYEYQEEGELGEGYYMKMPPADDSELPIDLDTSIANLEVPAPGAQQWEPAINLDLLTLSSGSPQVPVNGGSVGAVEMDEDDSAMDEEAPVSEYNGMYS